MIGVPGIAKRLFAALHGCGISVSLITQASEHSICVAVEESKRACESIRDAFMLELSRGQISDVKSVGPCTVLAIVGDAMRSTTGVAGRVLPPWRRKD